MCCYQDFFTPDGRNVLYFAEDAQHDSDLWLADSKFGNPRRLTHLNPQFDRYVMGSARLIGWRSLDEEPLKRAGDLVAGYGEMDKDGSTYFVPILESGQGLMGGAPWQYRERYIENSPIYYLNRIETPLLIVHGAEDKAVAPFLGDEIFVGLRRLGKDTEYAKYEGEDHSPLYWSYANQLDYCNRVITWFDKYLKVEGARLLGTDWPEIQRKN